MILQRQVTDSRYCFTIRQTDLTLARCNRRIKKVPGTPTLITIVRSKLFQSQTFFTISIFFTNPNFSYSVAAVHIRTKIDYVALRYCFYCQTLSEIFIKIHISTKKAGICHSAQTNNCNRERSPEQL